MKSGGDSSFYFSKEKEESKFGNEETKAIVQWFS